MAVELENATLQRVVDHLKKAEATTPAAFDEKINELETALQYLLVWAVEADKDVQAHNKGKVRGMVNLL